MAETVYIIYQHPLFAKGLENLLQREGLDVVGMKRGEERALEEIKTLQPEAVLLERSLGEEAVRFVGEILSYCPRITVIVLNLAEDWMQMVQSRPMSATRVEDLVAGIRGEIGMR